MLDLTATQDSSIGHLAKWVPKRDGRANRALIYNATFTFAVTDEADADKADKFLGGARAYFDLHKDRDNVGGIYVRPGSCSGKLLMQERESGTVLIDAVAEVTRAEMKKAAKSYLFSVEITLLGLGAVAASHLAAQLEERVAIAWANGTEQQSLPFHSPAASNAVQLVTIVDDVKGAYRFGMQTGVDGDRILIDDFGDSFEAPMDDVVSKIIVGPEHGTKGPPLTEVVAPYVQQIRDAGVTPSWGFLVSALASETSVVSNGVYTMTPDLMEQAVRQAVKAAP